MSSRSERIRQGYVMTLNPEQILAGTFGARILPSYQSIIVISKDRLMNYAVSFHSIPSLAQSGRIDVTIQTLS